MAGRTLRWRSGLTMLLVLAPFVGCPTCTCFTMGLTALHGHRADGIGEVDVDALADPARVPSDGFVSTTAHLANAEADPRRIYVESFFYVEEDPRVLVHCPYGCDAYHAGGPVRVEGRVCDDGSSPIFGCRLEPHVREFARAYAELQGEPPANIRVIALGELRHANLAGASCTLCMGGFFLSLLLLAFAVAVRGGRQGGPRVVETRTWSPPLAASEVERRLASLPGVKVVARGPGELVVQQGFSEVQARLLGLWTARHMPRRVTVRWTDQGPHRSTPVEARAEEGIEWMGKLPAPIEKRLRDSFELSFEAIEAALGVEGDSERHA